MLTGEISILRRCAVRPGLHCQVDYDTGSNAKGDRELLTRSLRAEVSNNEFTTCLLTKGPAFTRSYDELTRLP